MTNQILPFIRPEFSVIIEMTDRKEIIRDALKALQIIQTTFRLTPHFLTDDNLITSLFSVHIQLHLSITSLLNDIKS